MDSPFTSRLSIPEGMVISDMAETRARLEPKDWEIGAMGYIADHGLRALKITRLARSLGVTKGSFYWHFSGIDALLEATLARWEDVFTDRRLPEYAKIKDPRARLAPYIEESGGSHMPQRFYRALMSAQDHRLVAPVLGRVAAKRVRFLAKAFRDMGWPAAAAKRQAMLLYAAYLGLLHLADLPDSPVTDDKARGQLVAHATRLIVTEPPG